MNCILFWKCQRAKPTEAKETKGADLFWYRTSTSNHTSWTWIHSSPAPFYNHTPLSHKNTKIVCFILAFVSMVKTSEDPISPHVLYFRFTISCCHCLLWNITKHSALVWRHCDRTISRHFLTACIPLQGKGLVRTYWLLGERRWTCSASLFTCCVTRRRRFTRFGFSLLSFCNITVHWANFQPNRFTHNHFPTAALLPAPS